MSMVSQGSSVSFVPPIKIDYTIISSPGAYIYRKVDIVTNTESFEVDQ